MLTWGATHRFMEGPNRQNNPLLTPHAGLSAQPEPLEGGLMESGVVQVPLLLLGRAVISSFGVASSIFLGQEEGTVAEAEMVFC